jgi:hypothetical protein
LSKEDHVSGTVQRVCFRHGAKVAVETEEFVKFAAAKGVPTKFRKAGSAFVMGQRVGILALAVKDVRSLLGREEFVLDIAGILHY